MKFFHLSAIAVAFIVGMVIASTVFPKFAQAEESSDLKKIIAIQSVQIEQLRRDLKRLWEKSSPDNLPMCSSCKL